MFSRFLRKQFQSRGKASRALSFVGVLVGICYFVTRRSRLSGVNQLDGYATSSGTSGTPGQLSLTSFRTLPAKSNLKRRLIDCMESDESRSNVDEPLKKKRNIHFDAVTVYYFPRAQGFTCVPSQVSWSPFCHLSFQLAGNLCVTSRYIFHFFPLHLYLDRLVTLVVVRGSLNVAFKFRLFSVHCSGRVRI